MRKYRILKDFRIIYSKRPLASYQDHIKTSVQIIYDFSYMYVFIALIILKR